GGIEALGVEGMHFAVLRRSDGRHLRMETLQQLALFSRGDKRQAIQRTIDIFRRDRTRDGHRLDLPSAVDDETPITRLGAPFDFALRNVPAYRKRDDDAQCG